MPHNAAPAAGIMATMPQFVAKFSTPQTTEMMIGASEKALPYPKPTRAVVKLKIPGYASGSGEASSR